MTSGDSRVRGPGTTLDDEARSRKSVDSQVGSKGNFKARFRLNKAI